MTIRRLTMAIFAVVFAAFSSVAMLQSARPAMAAQTWNHAAHQQRVADRDDRRHAKRDRDDRRYRHPKTKHHAVRDHDRH
jgi:Ni/Co efflux regulator RcnB